MPTPKIHSGSGGKALSGIVEFAVVDWQLTIANRLAEATHSGSGAASEWVPTITDGSGTMNCLWDSTNIPDTGTGGPLDPTRPTDGSSDTVALKLYCGNSTKFYSFNAVIENLVVTSAIADVVKFSCSFKSSGPITGPV